MTSRVSCACNLRFSSRSLVLRASNFIWLISWDFNSSTNVYAFLNRSSFKCPHMGSNRGSRPFFNMSDKLRTHRLHNIYNLTFSSHRSLWRDFHWTFMRKNPHTVLILPIFVWSFRNGLPLRPSILTIAWGVRVGVVLVIGEFRIVIVHLWLNGYALSEWNGV